MSWISAAASNNVTARPVRQMAGPFFYGLAFTPTIAAGAHIRATGARILWVNQRK
jgi:hypothetical protein